MESLRWRKSPSSAFPTPSGVRRSRPSVSSKDGLAVDPRELSEFVAARIARYKKPKHVVFVKELPKKDSGEVDRERLKREQGGKY